MHAYTFESGTECELTCTAPIAQFLGEEAAEVYLSGDYQFSEHAPGYIIRPLDKAAYPTYQIEKTTHSFRTALAELERFGILWGRGSAKNIGKQRRMVKKIQEVLDRIDELNGMLGADVPFDKQKEITEELHSLLEYLNGHHLSLFSAHTKPVDLEKSPCWANLKRKKNEYGQALSHKTVHPRNEKGFLRQLKTFARIVQGVRSGIVDRVIVKYEVQLRGETSMFMDLRTDRIWRLDPHILDEKDRFRKILEDHFSSPSTESPPPLFIYEAMQEEGMLRGDPFYFVTGETEVNDVKARNAQDAWEEAGKPEAGKLNTEFLEAQEELGHAMGVIAQFYERLGAITLPHSFRWSDLALAREGHREFALSVIRKHHESLSGDEVVGFFDQMQVEGEAVFSTIEDSKVRNDFEHLPTVKKAVYNRIMDVTRIAQLAKDTPSKKGNNMI